MKIVFDNIVYSLQKAGGISVVWQELTSRFLQSGMHSVRFIEHPTDVTNIFRKEMRIPASMIIPESSFLLGFTRYLSPSVKASTPFIFHSSYFRLCKNKHAINVTTIHDFTYDYFYKGKRKGAFLHLWQRSNAVRKADAVVCISENTKRDLLKFIPGVNPSKIHVINNGVSKDYRVLPPSERIAKYNDWLIFVGHRGQYKNGYFFAECIKDTSYKVLFCGPSLTEQEICYFNEVLGPDRYEAYSGISNCELNLYYNSCKCLVYPSSYEGFGIPVLEAQAAGCPVIALNASSIPEVIGSNKTLLLQKLDKEELLSKLTLLEDEKLISQVIEDGLQNSKLFSWDVIQRQYEKLYNQVMNRK